MTSYEESVNSISDDRLQAVIDSLELVKPEITQFALKIFRTLFKENPEYLSQFPKLRDLPADKLESHKSFISHALAVVTAVATSVVNLKNSSLVLPELQKLGLAHQRRNIRPVQFAVVTNTILKVLKESISDPQVLSTWQEILNILSDTIMFYMNSK